MKFIRLAPVLFTFTMNIGYAKTLESFKKCETSFQKKQYNKIVKNCLNLEEDSQKAQLFKATAEILDKITYDRIESIFDYGEADPLMAKIYYKKKLYTNLEKHYLQEAFNKLKGHSEIKTEFISLLYAKIAYINIMYFQISEGGVSSSKTWEQENEFKSKIYYPNLEKYIQANPNDKEALYLLGVEGLRPEYPVKNTSQDTYSNVINKKYFGYLNRSAELGFYKSKKALAAVENWVSYTKKLRKIAESGDKVALFKIAEKQYDTYLDSNKQRSDLLDKAIIDFDKSQALGHRYSLVMLINIYRYDKPNKRRYSELLQKYVNIYDAGFMERGDLYWCDGNKEKAKEMYVLAQEKGDPFASYSLEDLKTKKLPIEGCVFK